MNIPLKVRQTYYLVFSASPARVQMAPLNVADLHNLEKRIQELKNSLSGISEERWRAALSKDERGVVKARIKASEKTLENCDAIANYLNNFSPPISKQIQSRDQLARTTLNRIKLTADAKELHKWIKTELVPSTKLSESLAHLAATSLRKAQGEDIEFHRWVKS